MIFRSLMSTEKNEREELLAIWAISIGFIKSTRYKVVN